MKSFDNIETIYNKYIDQLYAYGIHMGFDKVIIMDAIHDVFCYLCINNAEQNEVTTIKNYLFSALRNKLLNYKRDNKNLLYVESFPDDDSYFFNIKITIEDDLINSEEQEKIRNSINNILKSLTPRQREIVYLKYFKEYSYEEISEIMSIDINSCHKLMHKAMAVLRKNFGNVTKILIQILIHLFTLRI